MGKFSENNFARHRNLNQQIEEWNTKIRKAKNHIDDSGYELNQLKQDPQLLEKYAREQLNMHKADEDVYMIVYE
jgi:cell division protein FtsB